MTRKEARTLIETLEEAPQVIRLAKSMVEFLPKGKVKDALIRDTTKVKRALIALDVRLQDIEWSINSYYVNKEMEEKNKTNKEF